LSLNTAGSAIFEIIEMVIAKLVNPEAGAAYLGTQGDIWDAQMDMTMALTGSIVAFGLTELAVRSGRFDWLFMPRQQNFRTPSYK
jgi:putative membrane protein